MAQITKVESNFRKLFKDFLRSSYISGLQPLLLHTPVQYAKALWVAFLAIIVVWTHIVIINLTLEYIDQPTEIHMAPNLVHVSNSPFPAVGVCSSNMISRRLMQSYASKIYQHQSMHKTTVGNGSRYVPLDADNLARRLLVLSNFYLNAHDEAPLDVAELGQLHGLLNSYYNGSGYSVHDILRDLSPDCDDLVLRGLIYGAPVNTSQLFLKRSTTASVCCIFNYRRPSYSQYPSQRAQDDAEMSALPQVVFESNSILNGIQFVLQDIQEDDLTERYLSNTAFRLMIFPQEDYATVQSNKHGELLVDHNTIVEVPIQPKFFDSSNAVRGVTPQIRRCYFPEEGRQLLNQSYYSLDECILLCRIESMVQHCGCVSSPMAGTARNVSYCTLLDLPCLMKWRNIWYGYNEYPYVQEDAASVSQCLHCLPTCDGVNFEIISNVAPLRKSYNSSGYNRGLLKGLNNDRPLSIIKLFFKLRFAQATQMDMVGDWVVLLNRFGGILSLMYGFSIISYIEILYYLTGKWFVFYYRAYKSPKESSKANDLNKSLNWNELMPSGMEWYWRQELRQQPPEK
ncbi:sodium channel protein Nach [Drosophila novamexicana]|uniref:sodium channel protein Nach n=1 Tax=Drosophila novamexicana TaxID=47314 RepID=UPI0011E5FEC4|nr:sodium channel protein Nach [Drosophila novamexicana]